MLIFGHSGITLGVALFLSGAISSRPSPDVTKSETIAAASNSSCEESWLDSLAARMDIRLLLIGSLLPDIIDKLVGHFFFRETFNNGRIFSHTLLFLVLITAVGLYLRRHWHQRWLFPLAFGTLTHLIFDQMWRTPRTLFWPGFGFGFSRADISDWIPNILHALVSDPEVYVPELLGAAILIWFALTLWRRRKIYAFIRHGQTR